MELEEEKYKVLRVILKPWTKDEIKAANVNMIINSCGWVGGKYKEKDLKYIIFSIKIYLFEDNEIMEIKKYLLSIEDN